MCGKFWDILEIVVNSRYFLKSKEMRQCGYLKNMNIRLIDGSETKMEGGNIEPWYNYLINNNIKSVRFNAKLVRIESNEEEQANPDWEIWCIKKNGEIRIFDCYVVFIFEIGDWYQVLRERKKKDKDCFVNYTFCKKTLIDCISLNMAYAEYMKCDVVVNSFAMALRVLKGEYGRREIDEGLDELAPFILPKSYNKNAQKVIDALRCIQVFYGMGNWGDGVAPEEMISDLYEQYIRATFWAINEGDK